MQSLLYGLGGKGISTMTVEEMHSIVAENFPVHHIDNECLFEWAFVDYYKNFFVRQKSTLKHESFKILMHVNGEKWMQYHCSNRKDIFHNWHLREFRELPGNGPQITASFNWKGVIICGMLAGNSMLCQVDVKPRSARQNCIMSICKLENVSIELFTADKSEPYCFYAITRKEAY